MLQVQCDARVVQWLHRVSLEQKSAEGPPWCPYTQWICDSLHCDTNQSQDSKCSGTTFTYMLPCSIQLKNWMIQQDATHPEYKSTKTARIYLSYFVSLTMNNNSISSDAAKPF